VGYNPTDRSLTFSLAFENAVTGERYTTARGSDAFSAAFDLFGGETHVDRINGVWAGAESYNYNQFMDNIRAGMTPESAALATYTGRRAVQLEYGNVESVVIDEQAQRVRVVFTRSNLP
jgi:hypothetical protein